LESTRKIIENRFRVHKPSKSQKSTKSQQSTLLTIDLRHCAGSREGCAIAQDSCAMAQGPDEKSVFTRFEPKITYFHPKSLI
jgi:hypothetical protein